MLKLSIIVPVYNVEKYISKCLESLIRQDIELDEYEIIVINDGSTDNSLEIALEYEFKYKNIKVISQTNQGLGAARNTGMLNANGQYIMFVDSDDYLKKNSLQKILYISTDKNLDVLRFNYNEVDENGLIIPKRKNSLNSIRYSEKVETGIEFTLNSLGWACYVCLYIYNTDFLRKNNFSFVPNIYFEDVIWLSEILLQTKRICSVDESLYYYLQRAGSITKGNTKEKKIKIFNDKILVLNWIKQQSNENLVLKNWYDGFISLTVMGLFSFIANELPEYKSELLKHIKQQKYWPFKSYKFTNKQLRDLLIMNLNYNLYMWLKKMK